MSKYIERPLLAKFAEKTKKTAHGRSVGNFCRQNRSAIPPKQENFFLEPHFTSQTLIPNASLMKRSSQNA